MRVLIAVTHLLGAGHLTRAAALARAFAAAGHPTTLVSGGMPASHIGREGVAFVQLPPVKTAGTAFTTLLDEDDRPVDAARLDTRRTGLLEAFEAAAADLVVTELFPFGRRVLAPEFLALLERARAASPRPVIACSIRDILVAPTRPGRVAETHARLAAFYDAVFVHGDPALVPLELSWPVDAGLRPLLHYTGYVDEGPAVAQEGARAGIVVSGGSSPASLPLYRAAAGAAALLPDQEWRILMGRGVAEREVDAVRAVAPPTVIVERARPDFRDLLARARVSVSQAGYNTVVDLLRAGPFPILVPFEAGHETEQRLRAERLAARGLAGIVTEADLSAARLAQAVRDGLSHRSPPEQAGSALDPVGAASLAGAQRTVAIAERLVPPAPAVHAGIDWSAADEALRRARDQGRLPEVWWRDDDAVAHTPALDRLLGLAAGHGAGLALAAIPAGIEPSLRDALQEAPGIDVLVHGLAHTNHAPPDARKAEFGEDRPLDRLAGDARQGLALARRALGPGSAGGARLLPVFVPPWNRIAPALVGRLADLGFAGLSTCRDRSGPFAAPGLAQVNTHLDPIDWHGRRGLDEPARLVALLARAILDRSADAGADGEPIGLLTHHRVHDAAVWTFCERLLDWISRNTIQVRSARELFACEPDQAAVKMRYGLEGPRPRAEPTES